MSMTLRFGTVTSTVKHGGGTFTTTPECDNVINVTALQTILQRQHSVGILYLRIHS